MTTDTLTLTDFLLARIAEDDRMARDATAGPWVTYAPRKTYIESMAPDLHFPTVLMQVMPMGTDGDAAHIARHDPARVLAECAAKRRMVELHAPIAGACEVCLAYSQWDDNVFERDPCPTLRALASVYADHPEFRAEWAL